MYHYWAVFGSFVPVCCLSSVVFISSSFCYVSQDFRKTAQNWYINTYKIHLKFNTTENFEKFVIIILVEKNILELKM